MDVNKKQALGARNREGWAGFTEVHEMDVDIEECTRFLWLAPTEAERQANMERIGNIDDDESVSESCTVLKTKETNVD